MTDTPRAWVGCLACYNDGTLRGKWVDGTEASDYIPCIDSRHEEWWVFDHEGYDDVLKGECSPAEAQRAAEFIESVPDYVPLAAVVAWANNTLSKGLADVEHWHEIEDAFTDAYQGEHQSEQEYAEQYAEDIGAVDENARWPHSCIDWELATDELFENLWTAPASVGTIYVFRNT